MNFLITGISGTGKSTLARTISELGYHAVDVDAETDIAGSVNIHTGLREVVPDPRPIDWRPGHQWLWDGDKLKSYFEHQHDDIFLCGNAENQTDFYRFFAKVFVLTIDNEALTQRLTTRTNNSYGKHPHELASALEYNQQFTKDALDAGALPIDAALASEAIARQIIASC
ncbi:MAG: AAA family ATPase, partial [Candidatus Saccharibacteria bacterium]